MILRHLDPSARYFSYNPMGRRHAALSATRVTAAEVRTAAHAVAEVALGTRLGAADGNLTSTTTVRPRTTARVAGLALGACRRWALPRAQPLFPAIDALFGHVGGDHGAHIHGLLPQLGWISSAVGMGVGAFLGALVGIATLPAFAADGQPTAWLRRSLLTGAQAGACAGTIPRWWLCQGSASIGLGIKVALLVAVAAGLIVCKLAKKLATGRRNPLEQVAAADAVQASVTPQKDASICLTTLIAPVPLAREVAQAVLPAAVEGAREVAQTVLPAAVEGASALVDTALRGAQGAATPARWRDWGMATLAAGVYVGLLGSAYATP